MKDKCQRVDQERRINPAERDEERKRHEESAAWCPARKVRAKRKERGMKRKGAVINHITRVVIRERKK